MQMFCDASGLDLFTGITCIANDDSSAIKKVQPTLSLWGRLSF
jgi:hypothetical protein